MDHWLNGGPSEDVVFWELPFANFLRSGVFGICDGHSGGDTSSTLPRLLTGILSEQLSHSSSLLSLNQKDELHHVFLETDKKLNTDDGSTATVVLIERSKEEVCIQVANVGDSLGILIDTDT